MFTKSHIATIGVAVLVVRNIKFKIEAYKAAKLYLEASQAYEEERNIHQAQIQYLCHLLNEHNIEVDEFDMIALNFDTE